MQILYFSKSVAFKPFLVKNKQTAKCTSSMKRTPVNRMFLVYFRLSTVVFLRTTSHVLNSTAVRVE